MKCLSLVIVLGVLLTIGKDSGFMMKVIRVKNLIGTSVAKSLKQKLERKPSKPGKGSFFMKNQEKL